MAAAPTGSLFFEPRNKPLSVTGTFQPGCYRNFYLTGTTTPTNVYADGGLGTPMPQPVFASSDGRFPPIYMDSSVIYRVQLYNSAGVIQEDIDPYIPPKTSLTGEITDADLDPTSTVGEIVATYEQTPSELAAGVLPTNTGYPPGDIRRYGAVADSVTDNTNSIQSALTVSAGHYVVRVPIGTGHYKLTARITAPANTHIVMDEGSVLQWTATTATGTNLLASPTRPGIEVLGDNFIIEGAGVLEGPQGSSTYVQNECGLLRIGPSASNRGSVFIVRETEITGWGAYGVVLQYMEGIEVSKALLHNNGYMGAAFLSCQRGRIQNNKVYAIGPGTSGNMYGISMTHDSTNYNLDPNVTAAPRQTINPFCIDFDVAFNEIQAVNWIGIDAHGLYDSNVHHNKVYDCWTGIQVASGSNASANYAGENNKVSFNTVMATQINGVASTTTGHSGLQFGITVNGGSTLLHRGVEVIGNTIVGCGDTTGAGGIAYSIQATFMQDSVVQGNSIRNWYSTGIYGASFDGTISNNVFSAPSNATLSKCIWADTGLLHSTINGNRLELHGGSAAIEGLRLGGTTTRPVVSGNDFTAATTPYSGSAATFTAGLSDVIPRLQDSTTGSHAVDVSILGAAPIVYYQYTAASPATVTSITGGQPGQIVVLYNSGSSTLTVNNTGSTIKLSGGTAAITQFGSLTLFCNAASGNPSFVEIGRSLTNT